jgi:hypothetical protein
MIPALVILAIVALAALLITRTQKGTTSRAERRLVARVGAPRAASLIEFEMGKSPGASRAEAARSALERWEYDQSR